MHYKKIIIFSIIFSGIFVLAKDSLSAVALPWSTTYNCPEWDGTYCTLNCDGLYCGGEWTSSEGHKEQITSAANNPAGGGGRGQRHWWGDATNDNSGGTRISFSTPQTNIWIRFYVRFQTGFHWAGGDYHKIIYINNATSPYLEVDWPHSWDESNITIAGHPFPSGAGSGWDTVMVNGAPDPTHPGHNLSDGQFHCFEYHFQPSAGIWQLWLDGQLKVNRSNINFYGMSGIQYFLIGENHSPVNNGMDMYEDYDDFAVSNTGPIGCFSATSDTTPPAAPTNVTVI